MAPLLSFCVDKEKIFPYARESTFKGMSSQNKKSLDKSKKLGSQPCHRLSKVTTATNIILTEVANMLGWVMAIRPIGMGWAEYEDKKARRLVYEEREYLRMLKRRKFIETKRMGEKLMVRLTAKGWQQVLRDRIITAKKKCKDGMCLVIFDVPESERRVRDVLRDFLIDLDFQMIQKSVWATEKDVLRELCALLQGANLHQWVNIIVGKPISWSSVRNATTRLAAVIKTKKIN